jgi:hypothetical protein
MPLSVYIVESNSPEDFFLNRLDGLAASEVLKVRGVPYRYKVVFNRAMLERAITDAARLHPWVFHISCHGNENGIVLADGTPIPWSELARLCRDLAAPRCALVNASCEGCSDALASAFGRSSHQFGFVFGATKPVGFTDSCIAWSILYNEIAQAGNGNITTLRRAMTRINAAIEGSFVYIRWDKDKKRYFSFPHPLK